MIRRLRSHPEVAGKAAGEFDPRQAFTLLELLLVLSVIVTLAALSWPRLTGYLRRQTVEGNAEQVRQLLDHARIRAIEEGRTLQLRYEPQGRHYVLLPYEPMDAAQEATAAPTTTVISSTPPPATEPFRVYEVSEECFFHVDSSLVSGEATFAENLGEAWLGYLENGFGARAVSWSAPILYYPDGSATDGRLTVMDQERRYINLSVRGLTGTVYAEPMAVMSQRYGKTGD